MNRSIHHLTPTGRWRELLRAMKHVGSEDDCLNLVAQLTNRSGVTVLSFLNAHAANLAWGDPQFYRDLHASDVLLRDGIGIKLLMIRCGLDPGLNLNGTDFIPRLLSALPHTDTVALWGTTEPYLSRAANALASEGKQVTSVAHGFHRDSYYTELMRTHRPSVVLLGMGMPKQERVAQAISENSDSPTLVVNGGAILDFLGQRHPRAPNLLRALGLEWAYRLMREPVRLGARYSIGNVIFLSRTLRCTAP